MFNNILETCDKKSATKKLRILNCVSEEDVAYDYCTGGCGSSTSRPILIVGDAEPFEKRCECCTGNIIGYKDVKLSCTDDIKRTAKLALIGSCNCDVCIETGLYFWELNMLFSPKIVVYFQSINS